VVMNVKIDCSKKGRPKKRWKEVIDVNMKVRGLKRSNAVDRTFWSLGCRNRLTPACGDNKPGSKQMMTGKMKKNEFLHKILTELALA